MTSVELLSNLRILLDEVNAGFFLDIDCYSALTEGQRQIVNFVLSVIEREKINYTPRILEKLLIQLDATIAISANSFNLPSDFLKELSLQYNHAGTTSLKPCLKRLYDKNYPFNKNNTYLVASTTNEYYYSISSSAVIFETTASATAGYTLIYIKEPTDIDATTNPILSELAHDAIIQYAFSLLLKKDGKLSESMAELQKAQLMMTELIF